MYHSSFFIKPVGHTWKRCQRSVATEFVWSVVCKHLFELLAICLDQASFRAMVCRCRMTALLLFLSLFLVIQTFSAPIPSLTYISLNVKLRRITFNFTEPVILSNSKKIKIFHADKLYESGEVGSIESASSSVGYRKDVILQLPNSTAESLKSLISGAKANVGEGAFTTANNVKNLGICGFRVSIIACGTGKYLGASSSCQDCPTGRYSNVLNSIKCTVWDSCLAPATHALTQGTGSNLEGARRAVQGR